jgi:ABC-2 type transport system ATP-binding protein
VSRLDQKTLVVAPQAELSAPPPGFEDVHAQLRRNGALAVTYRTSEHSVEELLDRVRRAGVAIKDLSIEEPDLEDVFVALTTGAAA